MLYAVKGNKQLKIDGAEKATYLKLGYDIAKAEGNELSVIEVSPSSTVLYAQFKIIQDENVELKERLETGDSPLALQVEFEKLQVEFDKSIAENKVLKAKIKELEKAEKK